MALADRSASRPIGRDEAEAVLETRKELGKDYEIDLAESFADRVEQVIDARVAERTGAQRALDRAREQAGGRQLTLGIVSLGCGIPITAISGGIGDLPGIIAAWSGIALVNVAHALSNRRQR